MPINTDQISAAYRSKAVDTTGKRLLITRLAGSEQASDLSVPVNCDGLGRIHHFRRSTGEGWPTNPLPIDPACKALGLPRADAIPAQVFQNAVCNWRCWYCFVDFALLAGHRDRSKMVSPGELVDGYLDLSERPLVIDLSGGQPDLVPEWVPWMMAELQARGLERSVYLWSDDNLSNDYFWRFLTEAERETIATYRNYGRVCCFKGFNQASFAFNTKADPELFDRQFDLIRRLITVGMDLYAYATFTTPDPRQISGDMCRFVDRLQEVDENLPLRTVPLEVQVFTPVQGRLDEEKVAALKHQRLAVEAWQSELESRFSATLRSANIADVPLSRRGG